MLRSIGLRRFRGFRDFELQLDQPVAALLGANSSGKTSILQAVRVACQCAEQSLSHVDSDPRTEGDWVVIADRVGVAEPSSILPLMDWRQLFVDAQGGDKVLAEIELGFDEAEPVTGLTTTLAYGRNEKLLMSVRVRGALPRAANDALPPRTRDRAARFRQTIAGQLPVAVFAPAFYGVTRQEEVRSAKVIARALGSSDQSHIVRNLVARLDSTAKDRLNSFLRATFGAQLVEYAQVSDFEELEHLQVTYQDSNGPLELSSAGTGLTSAIALYASLSFLHRSQRSGTVRTALLLLDEPEAHLHPRLQGQVGDIIATAAREFDVQTLIATHSVELSNRLGRRPDAMLASIDRRSSTAVQLHSEHELVRALDEFCDLTPFLALSFLRSRRVAFVEGPSDWKILSQCASYLFRQDHQRLAAFHEYVGIPMEGVGNVSVKGVLERLLTPEVFTEHSKPARPFRAVVIRDRDATDTKAEIRSSLPRPRLEALEVTWSRYSIESLFLDPVILGEWISALPSVRAPRDVLERIIAEAIERADRDPDLVRDAIGYRIKYLSRADSDGNVNQKAAYERASIEIPAEPARWQHGRARARAVLHAIRELLGKDFVAAARQVRGSIVDLLEAANLNRLGPGHEPVPEELRELLTRMVDPKLQ